MVYPLHQPEICSSKPRWLWICSLSQGHAVEVWDIKERKPKTCGIWKEEMHVRCFWQLGLLNWVKLRFWHMSSDLNESNFWIKRLESLSSRKTATGHMLRFWSWFGRIRKWWQRCRDIKVLWRPTAFCRKGCDQKRRAQHSDDSEIWLSSIKLDMEW